MTPARQPRHHRDTALPGPPPLTSRSTDELQAALQLPEAETAESRAALLRCLEFFGSNRVSADEVDIPLRLPPLEVGGGPVEEAVARSRSASE